MLQKAVKDKQRTLTKLQQEIKEKKKENAALDQELRELQVCILERREIEELAGKSSQARHNPWDSAPNISLVIPMCSYGLTCHVHVHTHQFQMLYVHSHLHHCGASIAWYCLVLPGN